MTRTYDAIIIGTGQAGPFLAQRLAQAGMKVAIIERESFGGTCVNTGCIPSKTMVASAYAAHMVRRAADFGVVNNGPVSVDMKLVKSRKDAISGQSRRGVENWLSSMPNRTVYQGHGRFESSKEVTAGTETHEILGAAILGTGADEAIHSILNAMYARAPYTVIQRAMHIHPTVSELIPTMLGELHPLSDGAGAPQ